MFVESVSFENYRNLRNSEFFPSKGINVIYGENAQGKTNIIECMWLFTGGRSFRGAKDRELIAFDQKYSKVKASFFSTNRRQNVEILIQNNKRKAALNNISKDYMSQIIGNFCAVIFSPQHMNLIKNGPEERRNFIDSALCQIKPQYASILSRYKKILIQRNALLKSIQKNPGLSDTLDIWNERLAETGSHIAVYRHAYISSIRPLCESFYEGISQHRESLNVAYRSLYINSESISREDIKSSILISLQSRQNEDIILGYTTRGIHRDDISFTINGKDARIFGSQGQQRSAVLALKLSEASLLGSSKGESPVILLDDVLSELDLARQNYLLNKLEDRQVFITCCDPDITAQNKFLIKNGEIFPTG